MISIVRTIFGRLHALDPATEEARLLVNGEEPQHGDISMSVSTTNATDTGHSPSHESEEVISATQENTTVTLGSIERSSAVEVEALSQSLSNPRPCKPQNLVYPLRKFNGM